MSISDPAYDPFRRHDRYGTGGEDPQPLSEKILLSVLTVLVVPIKVTAALACLVWFYAFCRVSVLIPEQYRGASVAAAGKLACRSCLLSLGFIHVRWIRRGKDREGVKAAAIVSNHCSWLDILVHMSKYFPAFVARDSTKDLTMIGLISQKMGCLFVDRGRKDGETQVLISFDSRSRMQGYAEVKGVGAIVKERISCAARGEAEGERPMLLFPEGTTTNGLYLLPFKSGAFLAGCPLQPVILQYQQGRVSPAWETINALRHIWLILTIPLHSVTVIQLPLYTPSKEESSDPSLYARNMRQYMLDHCKSLQASSSVFADKQRFHALLKKEKSGSKKSQ